jgi:DNA-binding transcriptional MerR regulator
MYTISQASARSGIPVPLLRAWERRYAVVSPTRTASGYRLYDEVAIARLTAMRRLVDEGWTASQAAAEVLRRGVGSGAPDARPTATPEAPPNGIGVDGADDPATLVDAASRFDTAALERTIDRLFARGSYESVIDDLVLPAVAALGAGWADGTLDIAAEHLASEAVQRRLAALFDG